jgi:hypothetical protein
MNSTGVPVRTSLVIGGVHLLGVGRKQDERLETGAAFPAVPNMTRRAYRSSARTFRGRPAHYCIERIPSRSWNDDWKRSSLS